MTVCPKFVCLCPFSLFMALVLGSLSWAYSGNASATTYYVRVDGGTPSQCTGKSDAAYPGSGTGKACAWQHPFNALPPFKTARMAGGDTLIISPGSYMMGYGAPDTDACASVSSYDCILGNIPSGPSALQPTRILGKGYASSCTSRPELWGTQRAYAIFKMEKSSNVELSCLELTDHSTCIKSHNHTGNTRGETSRCSNNGYPYGTWAEHGIIASDSQNVLLNDLNIHGFAVNGVRSGRLKDWTMQDVKIVANGWAGWDGDIAPGNQTQSSNSGNIIFKGGEIAWNGCAERYPTTQKFGCWAQENGGYGDGLGTGRTGGNWLFDGVHIHHNTSDGLDLLYMNGTGSVTVRRVRAEANAGNQIKVAGTSLIENSVAIGNCAFFATFPTSNLTGGENCRAMGNTLSVNLIDSSVATVRHNTVTGQGDCQLITVGGNTSAKVVVQDNAFIGDIEWQSRSYGPELSCGHYAESSAAPVVFEKNLFWNVKNGQCPAGSICNKNPNLTNPVYESYNATPRPGSPLIDSATTIPAVVSDFFNNPRPYGPKPDVGAIEVQPAVTRVTGGAFQPSLSNGSSAVTSASQYFQQPAVDNAVTTIDGRTPSIARHALQWQPRGMTLLRQASLIARAMEHATRSNAAILAEAVDDSLASLYAWWKDGEGANTAPRISDAMISAAARARTAADLATTPVRGLASSFFYDMSEEAVTPAAHSNESATAKDRDTGADPSGDRLASYVSSTPKAKASR